jgi:hypothetical protein
MISQNCLIVHTSAVRVSYFLQDDDSKIGADFWVYSLGLSDYVESFPEGVG